MPPRNLSLRNAILAGWALSLLALLILLWPAATVAADGSTPVSIDLARDGQALHRVIVAVNASEATKSTATELAGYLGRISGATFHVETGDGSQGIVVGTATGFPALPFSVEFGNGPFDREDYILRSHAQGLYLLGATDLAVSHAVWDLLYRLGYRQFFPGETWEVVPVLPRMSIAIDCRETPAFHARRIWYNWGLWGYNDQPYRDWCQRNRAVKGFDLNSGHSYEAIIAANRKEFDEHPEYYALLGGKRKYRGGDTKFCISNPGLRKLVIEYAVRTFQNNPQADSISMDPSDGGGWCECDSCAAMGSVSNRVVTLANEVAQAANALELGPKYVGIYAYNEHSTPPTVRVDAHVIPSATTAFIRGGYTFDQIVDGWQAQGATMGVYDYLSVVDWDWNLPRGSHGSRPSRSAQFLPRIHEKGVRFYDAESGDCWGPCGLGYYVTSRVLWDIEESQKLDALVEDFLERSFGTAKEPMRKFYHLITEDTARRPPSDLVGRMYRQLDEARRATADAKVLARIDDLILYTRYAELYYAYAGRSGSVEEVARHAYRMRKTMMVHSYGLWCRLLSQQAALDPDHPLKTEQPFSPQDIAQILADGIAANLPVDPGFESIQFSKALVPAAPWLSLPATPTGSFPTASAGSAALLRLDARERRDPRSDDHRARRSGPTGCRKSVCTRRWRSPAMPWPSIRATAPMAKPYPVQLRHAPPRPALGGDHRRRRLHPDPVAPRDARHDRVRDRHAQRHGTLSRRLDDGLLCAARDTCHWRLGVACGQLGPTDLGHPGRPVRQHRPRFRHNG